MEAIKEEGHRVEDLKVFARAYKTSLEVHQKTLEFPRIEHYGLGDQMRRASKSICINLAEGFAKQSYSKDEFKRYVMIALGSSDEMQVLCHYVNDLKYVDSSIVEQWQASYQEISRMLQGLFRKV